jgi:hypothetical protein
MPAYRVILKKTKYFPKGSPDTGRRLKRYLSKYMDEIEKGKQKNRGENPTITPKTPTPQPSLPDETSGTFWTGGFLGHTKSPSSYEKNKQKGWIINTKNNWIQLLSQTPSRRNDGFRFVLSLSKPSLETLTKENQSPDQALREIWRLTIQLYRKQHQWSTPENDIGWIASPHHDTQNTHLHILLFPTTRSGIPLRTNNQRGPDKENDLNNLIALSNIAAEIYWRENLPLNAQSKTYISHISQNPTNEPPLQTLENFQIPSGLPQKKPRQPTPPKIRPNQPDLSPWNQSLLSPEEKEQSDIETGQQSLLQTIRKQKKSLEEINTLQATLITYDVWGPKKINPWIAKKTLDSKPNTLKSLQEKLPDEYNALTTLLSLEPLLPEGKAKKILSTLKAQEIGHALLALTTGLKETPTPTEISQGLPKAAAIFEKSSQEIDPPEKLKNIYQEGLWAKREKLQEIRRTQNYKTLLKAVEHLENQEITISNTKTVIKTLIQGSQTLTQALQARTDEAHHATQKNPDGSISAQKTTREWTLNLNTNQFETKSSQGKPWPPHIDPELILPKLQNPPPITNTRTPIQNIPKLLSDTKPIPTNEESPLIRFIKSKRLRKRKLAQEIAKELENLPEITPPT